MKKISWLILGFASAFGCGSDDEVSISKSRLKKYQLFESNDKLLYSCTANYEGNVTTFICVDYIKGEGQVLESATDVYTFHMNANAVSYSTFSNNIETSDCSIPDTTYFNYSNNKLTSVTLNTYRYINNSCQKHATFTNNFSYDSEGKLEYEEEEDFFHESSSKASGLYTYKYLSENKVEIYDKDNDLLTTLSFTDIPNPKNLFVPAIGNWLFSTANSESLISTNLILSEDIEMGSSISWQYEFDGEGNLVKQLQTEDGEPSIYITYLYEEF